MGIWGETAGGSVGAGCCRLILGEGTGPVCWAGGEGGTWLAALMPKCVRLVVRLLVLLELDVGKVIGSSRSSGVGRGGGNWMFVRSGKEPPVLWAAGIKELFISWSGDGNMLEKWNRICCEYPPYGKSHETIYIHINILYILLDESAIYFKCTIKRLKLA